MGIASLRPYPSRSLLIRIFAALLLVLLHSLAQAQTSRVPAQPPAPTVPTTAFGIAALDKPVEILVDSWGIPHIYARSQYDAFFAQGFNAARDRLWQIDLWRRKGLGLLAEVFGPSAVARDHAARLFLYRDGIRRGTRSSPGDRGDSAADARPADSDRNDLYREWLAYASDTKRITESFVAGINAYVKLIEQNADLLPAEFRLLDYKPSLWSPGDLLRIRAHGAWGNLKSEVRRAQIGCIAGLQADFARRSLEPAQVPKIPDGVDLCEVRDEVLTLYRLATSDIAFTRAVGTAASSAEARATSSAPMLTIVPVEPADVGADAELGSVIAIGPRASASNKPMLAIDLGDRRVHASPSSRYFAHLSAPGLNAIGAGDPMLPGLGAGHNERIAWGPARYPIDQEDLVVADVDSAGDMIRVDGRSEPIEIVEETIPVRGAAPATVSLRFTRHGPVVHQDKAKAWIVRAGWLETGMAPSMASLELMRAQGWDSFVAAMNRWGGTPSTQLYADVDGTIGSKAGGLAPIRRDHDGLLPVTAAARHRWSGFADNDRLPSELNPARGWIVQAGQAPGALVSTSATAATAATAPATWPPPLEWSPRWRADRIAELLERTEKKTAPDLFAIQSDVLSILARRLVLLLKDTQTQDLKVDEAITLLRNWDFRLTAESPAAALFQVWYDRHLAPAMLALRTQQGVPALIDVADGGWLLGLIEQSAGRIGRDTVVVGTLRKAIAEMEQRQGTNWLRWNWGALHRAEFTHPLSAVAGAVSPAAVANLAGASTLPILMPRPRGGGAFTVGASTYRASTLSATGSASARMVFDLANWDNALALNAPGQSGDPRSRHYADLVDAWSKDAAHPLLFSRAAVEKATVLRILLNPLP